MRTDYKEEFLWYVVGANGIRPHCKKLRFSVALLQE